MAKNGYLNPSLKDKKEASGAREEGRKGILNAGWETEVEEWGNHTSPNPHRKFQNGSFREKSWEKISKTDQQNWCDMRERILWASTSRPLVWGHSSPFQNPLLPMEYALRIFTSNILQLCSSSSLCRIFCYSHLYTFC